MSPRALLLALALLALAAPRAAAQLPQEPPELIADLSHHLIAITSDFTGTDLLVFGVADPEGELIVVVRGPRVPVVVRKKERVFGIWMNTRSATFNSVPLYYAVAASGPLAEIADADSLRLLEIGMENLRLEPEPELDPEIEESFEQALIELKQASALYPREPSRVDRVAGRLFRASIHFPAAVPVGTYVADVFLLKDGLVVAAQTSPLVIHKAGFGAEVFDFAHESSALYGLLAVVGAAMAGFLGSLLFRRP